MTLIAIYVENVFIESKRLDNIPRIGDAVVLRDNTGLRVSDVKWVLDYGILCYVELHLVNTAWERGPR